MTKTQAIQFNRMRAALRRIAKGYKTPDQLRRDSNKDWGLDYEEALEMSYENIQNEAAGSVKGVKEVLVPKGKSNENGLTEPATDTGSI